VALQVTYCSLLSVVLLLLPFTTLSSCYSSMLANPHSPHSLLPPQVVFSLYVDKKTNKRIAKNVRLTDETIPGMNGDQTGILDVVVLRYDMTRLCVCSLSSSRFLCLRVRAFAFEWHSAFAFDSQNAHDASLHHMLIPLLQHPPSFPSPLPLSYSYHAP
jgi:hypothetical protein